MSASDTPETDEVWNGEWNHAYLRSRMQKLERERDAARSAGWRPIETAPKDGSVIDLWANGERIPECWWKDYPDGEGDWILETYKDGSGMTVQGATHWMPLPEPPEANVAPEHRSILDIIREEGFEDLPPHIRQAERNSRIPSGGSQ